jgi:hypothetical protein
MDMSVTINAPKDVSTVTNKASWFMEGEPFGSKSLKPYTEFYGCRWLAGENYGTCDSGAAGYALKDMFWAKTNKQWNKRAKLNRYWLAHPGK